MPVAQHTVLRDIGYRVFVAAGAPSDEARTISDHLVDANLVGHDSHGILRLPGYAKGMERGVTPRSQYEVVKETPTTAVIDAHGGLGIIAAFTAMDLAIQKARTYTFGAVGVHHCGHTGRLGDFPIRAAREGMIGFALLNGGGPIVVPFGGTVRRLPPNPIAFAAPRKGGPPIMLDITTSIVAGGKVDVKEARGEKLPEGWMVDVNGDSVTDPSALRAKTAAILPLGGPAGHKGFGLAIMVDLLAGGLSWAGCSREQPTRGLNGFLAMAIKIESFIDPAEFEQEAEYLVEWVKSSPRMPGVQEIYVPGEVEERARAQRLKEGIFVEDKTWQAIVETATRLGVAIPEAISGR